MSARGTGVSSTAAAGGKTGVAMVSAASVLPGWCPLNALIAALSLGLSPAVACALAGEEESLPAPGTEAVSGTAPQGGPRLAVGVEMRIPGRLREADVVRAVRAHEAALCACLPGDRGGAIEVAVKLDRSGAVLSSAEVGPAAPATGCIEAAVAGWRFPVPRDESGAPAPAAFVLTIGRNAAP